MADKKTPEKQESRSLPTDVAPLFDQFQGLGGRYIRDSKTGKRTRVQHTKRCADCKSITKD